MDDYEKDMVTAVFSGKGPEWGANMQFLRRLVAEQIFCQRHHDMLTVDHTVAVEIRNKTTGRCRYLIICADAYDEMDIQIGLQGASANIAISVYDGRRLFGTGQQAAAADTGNGSER